MQIQLKQADIEQAIRSHIAAIGITREVSDISFTMGRNGAGLSAGVEVSDTDNRIRPGGGLCHEIPQPVYGESVPRTMEKAADSVAPVAEKVAESEEANDSDEEDTPPFAADPANEETDEEAAPVTKNSLFGNAS